jgi:hypothetical protein
MFGNGQDAPAPPDTGSLWGEMFGMGSLFKMISDPALMAHTHQMLNAVIEGANASRRIEAKLDRLLGALGHEISDINARFPAAFQPPGATQLLEGNAAAGNRGDPAATRPPDDGSRGAPGGVATAGVGSRSGGPHDGAADDGA